MRTATSKKGIAKPIPLTTKKVVVKKLITTISKTKGLKPIAPLINRAPAIPESPKTKQSQLIALLKDPKGSNIQELMQATGWQAHSVRGVISGVIRKRLGLSVISEKMDGVQHYRIESA
ncbi:MULTISPECIES: DUF3489 domain-containing protein [unclassified Polynucleobacter]|uniref:DUF3489 domain-containing protein n=1 Tax=unclassified Polynucleobacter TaxID=2640945 RepID=UPI000E9A7DD2|nr:MULTISPECIES: DUF3489 domain-containing protein [unclassified Polynucleobacter]HBK43062.1 hypothetical protein [Polynucleobacter sp.]